MFSGAANASFVVFIAIMLHKGTQTPVDQVCCAHITLQPPPHLACPPSCSSAATPCAPLSLSCWFSLLRRRCGRDARSKYAR